MFLEFQGLLGWGYYLIMLPFRFTYYTILDIFRYVPLCLYTTSSRVGSEAETQTRVSTDAQSFFTSQFVTRLNILPALSFCIVKKNVFNCYTVEGVIIGCKLVLAVVCRNQINLPVFGLSPSPPRLSPLHSPVNHHALSFLTTIIYLPTSYSRNFYPKPLLCLTTVPEDFLVLKQPTLP